MSKNIYNRTYPEQIQCNYDDVPILTKSPFDKKIHETRAKFLEQESVYNVDTLVELITNPSYNVPIGFTFFKTDLIKNNVGISSKLEFSFYYKQQDKFHFNLKFGKSNNKISFCIEQDEIYIYNFLNSTNNFGESGLGHTTLSFIKTLALKLKMDIKLTYSNLNSLSFYEKEGFELVSKNGDEMIWKWNREKLEQQLKQAQLVQV